MSRQASSSSGDGAAASADDGFAEDDDDEEEDDDDDDDLEADEDMDEMHIEMEEPTASEKDPVRGDRRVGRAGEY